MAKLMRGKETETPSMKPGEFTVTGTDNCIVVTAVEEDGRCGVLLVSVMTDKPRDGTVATLSVTAAFQAEDGRLLYLQPWELGELATAHPMLWAMAKQWGIKPPPDPKLRLQ